MEHSSYLRDCVVLFNCLQCMRCRIMNTNRQCSRFIQFLLSLSSEALAQQFIDVSETTKIRLVLKRPSQSQPIIQYLYCPSTYQSRSHCGKIVNLDSLCNFCPIFCHNVCHHNWSLVIPTVNGAIQ
jgi:hypothetical protein